MFDGMPLVFIMRSLPFQRVRIQYLDSIHCSSLVLVANVMRSFLVNHIVCKQDFLRFGNCLLRIRSMHRFGTEG